LEKIAESALNSVASLTKRKPSGVVAINKSEGGWIVQVELVEKESIPSSMDVLGLYEVTVDENGNLLEFKRKSLRNRADTEE
jgi:hypothetical protein